MPPSIPYKNLLTTPSQLETAHEIVLQIIHLLKTNSSTLATAESLTDGLLSSTICSIPDASTIYRGGITPCTTLLLQNLLNVSASSIRKEGAVSASVAAQMALGVLQKTSCHGVATTWGLSTTGVAAPEGYGCMPPGTVYIGIAHGEAAEGLGPFYFEGERNEVREAAVLEALAQLREAITASRL